MGYLRVIIGLVGIGDRTVGVTNDNNYPFSVGRHAETTGEPDDNEFILVRLPEKLSGLRFD